MPLVRQIGDTNRVINVSGRHGNVVYFSAHLRRDKEAKRGWFRNRSNWKKRGQTAGAKGEMLGLTQRSWGRAEEVEERKKGCLEKESSPCSLAPELSCAKRLASAAQSLCLCLSYPHYRARASHPKEPTPLER